MTGKVLVIGAGLAGISQALAEHKTGCEVVIVEKAGEIGGLLTSFESSEGLEFPIGTHFLNKFENPYVNELLYEGLDWKHFEYIKMGHVANGRLDKETGFLNISYLPLESQIAYYAALVKGLAARRYDSRCSESLFDYIYHRHGEGVAYVFDDISQARFGQYADKLAADSLNAMVLTQRVKAFWPGASDLLKRFDYFDKRLAFHSCRKGATLGKSFVPKDGHYKKWWRSVRSRLESKGIKVLTKARATYYEDRVDVIHNGSTLRLSLDKWKVIDSVGISSKHKASSVDVRTNVRFFVADEAPTLSCHYITNYDSSLPFSRLTLCDNIWDGSRRFVVENVYSGRFVDWEEQIIEAMKSLKIYTPNTRIRQVGTIEMLNTGFTPKLLESSYTADSSTIGIASGKRWFMHEHV